VLSDLGAVLEQVDLPVRGGWCMPKGVEPWRRPERPAGRRSSGRTLSLRAEPLPSQRRAAIAVLGGAIFTTIAMSVMFGARVRRGDAVAPLSWALAIGTIALLYVIGIFIASDHLAIRSDGDLVRIERRAFGRVRTAREIRRGDVIAAYTVGPAPDDPRHVLVETHEGVVSVPAAGDSASTLVRALSD
jgi:hypothetical protein